VKLIYSCDKKRNLYVTQFMKKKRIFIYIYISHLFHVLLLALDGTPFKRNETFQLCHTGSDIIGTLSKWREGK